MVLLAVLFLANLLSQITVSDWLRSYPHKVDQVVCWKVKIFGATAPSSSDNWDTTPDFVKEVEYESGVVFN